MCRISCRLLPPKYAYSAVSYPVDGGSRLVSPPTTSPMWIALAFLAGVVTALIAVYIYEFAQFLHAYGHVGGPPWERAPAKPPAKPPYVGEHNVW